VSASPGVPTILVVDDLFGRTLPDRRNEERANLCGQFLLKDITGDEENKAGLQRIKRPVAQAVFCRGQSPSCAAIGDYVRNDPEETLRVVRERQATTCTETPGLALVLLDLCFHTGRVTVESDRKTPGMPEGHERDEDPRRYFGLCLLDTIYAKFPDLPVVVLSSQTPDAATLESLSGKTVGFLARTDADGPELLLEYIRLSIRS